MRLFVHNSYERGVFMFRYSYEILVNKQNRLDKAFVPRPLVRPAIPFDASADDPKRLLGWNIDFIWEHRILGQVARNVLPLLESIE